MYSIADINECANTTLCGAGAKCDNTPGSHLFNCDFGFDLTPSGCIGN